MRVLVRSSGRFVFGLVGGLAVLLASGTHVRATEESSLHAPFDALLEQFVDDRGRVAYRDLAVRAAGELDAYLADLAATDPSTLSAKEQVAFWLNAYNAHAIKGVLDGHDAEGILARKRFFSWYRFRLAGAERTLDEVEHRVLRSDFAEPRIHFALVCASSSCPILRREAYRGSRLEDQLDDQTRRFLDDPSRNRFAADEVELSRIFEWFATDFERAAGSVGAFIARYRSFPQGAEISYLDYDWTLNAQAGQRPD